MVESAHAEYLAEHFHLSVMSFDRLAPFYRAMETVLAGSVLQRCRIRFLDDVVGADTRYCSEKDLVAFLSNCCASTHGCK